MQRTFNHAQLAPRKKKRRMPPPCLASKTDRLLDSAEGCKYTPQAADKQAFVLWAAYCLYLQPSAVEKARTLHLCSVGATADCESVHRSCPSCGSRIHSQQVSVLGQLLNGILWRRIPSRTPVSSGLRSTKAFFKWNITPTHPDPTDVILAIRRDTQGCCKLGCNDALEQKRRRQVELLWRKQTFQAIKALTALLENIRARRSRSWSLGIANRTRHVGLLLLRRTDAMMGCHRRYASVLKQCSRRMQKILPAVRRDTQEIQARFTYLNGCNELMQQVGLKRRVTEFTSVVDNAGQPNFKIHYRKALVATDDTQVIPSRWLVRNGNKQRCQE